MKKTIKLFLAGLVFTGLVSGSAFAKEGFSFSGFWKDDSYRSGGSIEIGFPNLYESDGFFVRDSLELGGAGLLNEQVAGGTGMFTDKLFFGGKQIVNGIYMKSYGFAYAGTDLYFLSGTNHGKVDLGFDFGGGGGFEIGFENSKTGFVVEYGGGYCLVPNKLGSLNQISPSFGYNSLTLGFRQYF